MNRKQWIISAIAAIVIIALAVVLILTAKEDPGLDGVEAINVDDINVDISMNGISVVSVDSIAGIYVEDGTDEVMDNILTVTFRNDSDKTLQYAKMVLTVGEDDYSFEISTIPAGASVRAMEMNRKTFIPSKGEITLTQENIAWFDDEPSLYEDELKITQRNNAIILENISDRTINAPVYVYYKSYTDEVYVGGITYRAGTQESIEPGSTVVISAKHFDPEASELMFVTYAP